MHRVCRCGEGPKDTADAPSKERRADSRGRIKGPLSNSIPGRGIRALAQGERKVPIIDVHLRDPDTMQAWGGGHRCGGGPATTDGADVQTVPAEAPKYTADAPTVPAEEKTDADDAQTVPAEAPQDPADAATASAGNGNMHEEQRSAGDDASAVGDGATAAELTTKGKGYGGATVVTVDPRPPGSSDEPEDVDSDEWIMSLE